MFVTMTFRANKKAWLIQSGDPLIVYLRQTDKWVFGPGTSGGISKTGEFTPALAMVLDVDRNFESAGGDVRVAIFEEWHDWRKTQIPRIE